jgi:hypothetical protein
MKKTILFAGLGTGVCDITAACIVYGMKGATPARIFRSVARGLLGAEAAKGGTGTAALGLALHFVIAFIWATIYVVASRRIPMLVKHAIPISILYGIFVWLCMNFIVLPLSAAGMPKFTTEGVVTGILIHMFCVGLPTGVAVKLTSSAGK